MPPGHTKESLHALFPYPSIWFAAALLAGTTACSDSAGPTDTTRPPDQLNLVRLAPTSPPLFNAADSFYAKKGEDRELRIFFQDWPAERARNSSGCGFAPAHCWRAPMVAPSWPATRC